ncbi:hypothetical protein D9V84_03545 [Bacteroidetes/Chlorobi group bacterium Naka2016]|nr:MAG: hypothetical protein D9V84_03545 [Bacteroidetes/Chlorobi group bacterium Naka2016]
MICFAPEFKAVQIVVPARKISMPTIIVSSFRSGSSNSDGIKKTSICNIPRHFLVKKHFFENSKLNKKILFSSYYFFEFADMKSWKAETLLLVITIVWGATFSFTKIGLEFCTPLTFTFFRFAIALVVALSIWGRSFLKISRIHLIAGIVLGLFYAGGFVFQTIGLKFTTVTKSAFITGLSVAFTPFVYKIVESKKISIFQWLGVAIVVVGLWLFTNPKIDNINIGDVLTLLSTFFWAFYIVYMNRFTNDVTDFKITTQIVVSQFLVVFAFGLLGSISFEWGANIIFNFKLVIALLYNGIIATVVLTTIHTSVQKYTTPVKAALIFSLEPVFASIFALVIFNEILKPIEYLGAFLILLGVATSEFGGLIFKRIGKESTT